MSPEFKFGVFMLDLSEGRVVKAIGNDLAVTPDGGVAPPGPRFTFGRSS